MVGVCVMLMGSTDWNTAVVDTAAAHMPLPLMALSQLQLGDNTKFSHWRLRQAGWNSGLMLQ